MLRCICNLRIRFVLGLLVGFIAGTAALSFGALQITSLDSTGMLQWTSAPSPAICTIEGAVSMNGIWEPLKNVYSIQSTGSAKVALGPSQFFRVRTVHVPPTRAGFTNFVQAHGILETVAGDGFDRVDNTSFWQPHFEGGPAANASLSRPHYAMADGAGNIYIADKNSHSVLRVETNGTIHTHAGTHVGGFNGEGPMTATSMQLNAPNAMWVRADGTVYVLDTENGRVRRIGTNGIATTLFMDRPDGSAVDGGRMLWVSDDETVAYYGNENRIRRWRSSDGVKTYAKDFQELGTFYVEPNGDLIVADRGDHYVYRITTEGVRTIIAGNGSPSGGADGDPATEIGLNGPRGIWPVPTGGYLILLHDGSQLWYLDTAGMAHLLVNGAGGTTHSGDGEYFYNPSQLKISEGRSVSMDHLGNILICESDYGYVRRIRFERLNF